MDTPKQPNRAKYKAKTHQNTSFEDWWVMVVECYTEGFLDCPAIGANPDYPFDWWTPTREQVEAFRNNAEVKEKYAQECYRCGEDPGTALDSMD